MARSGRTAFAGGQVHVGRDVVDTAFGGHAGFGDQEEPVGSDLLAGQVDRQLPVDVHHAVLLLSVREISSMLSREMVWLVVLNSSMNSAGSWLRTAFQDWTAEMITSPAGDRSGLGEGGRDRLVAVHDERLDVIAA